MKKILAVLFLMVLICGSLNGFEISVTEAATEEEVYDIVGRNCPELFSETEIEHNINKGYVRKYCKFVPEKSDWYIYYSSSDIGVAGYIYNSDLSEMLIESDNYEYSDGNNVLTGDFKLKIYLEAGETYYLGSHLHMGNHGIFKVGIKEVPAPTAISITDSEVYEAGLGRREVLDVYFLPEDSDPEELSWTSADPEIVEINDEGECFYKNLGTTTVTATSKSGLTDSVTVNVVVKDGIKEGEKEFSYPGTRTFVFIPEEDGIYRFSVTVYEKYNYIDTSIIDKNNVEIGSTSLSSVTKADMYAGEHYYLTYTYTVTNEPNYGCFIPMSYCECIVERVGNIKNNTPVPDPVITDTGDVNMDGIVNSEDALEVLKYSARLISFEEKHIGLADVDGNDIIDATDALEILKSAARINEK